MGAIEGGKANMHELGLGTTCKNYYNGDARSVFDH